MITPKTLVSQVTAEGENAYQSIAANIRSRKQAINFTHYHVFFITHSKLEDVLVHSEDPYAKMVESNTHIVDNTYV